MPKTPSAANLKERLSIRHVGDTILLDGERIGGWVSYGSRSGRLTGNVSSKTVYGSRIMGHSVSIQVEGSTCRAMLNKVAAELAKAMREGKWPVPPAPQIEVGVTP